MIPFSSVQVGQRFIYQGQEWEKVPQAGCCRSKFNAVNITDKKTHKQFNINDPVELKEVAV